MQTVLTPLLMAGSAGAFLIWSLLNPDRTERLFLEGSYPLLIALAVGCIHVFRRHIFRPAEEWKALVLRHSSEIAVAAALSLFVFLTVPPAYRVLSDETTLLTTSRSMVFSHDVSTETEGVRGDGLMYPEGYEVPKRPLLFPFLLSILHVLTRYRVENAFALNFLGLFGLLLVVQRILRRWISPGQAGLIAFLLITQPLLSLHSASAGFDVFSVFMIALTALFSLRYLESPDRERFLHLVAILTLLAHSRYESVLVGAGVFGLLAIRRQFSWRTLKESALELSLLPFAALPLIWQFVLSRGKYENPEESALFDISRIPENSKQLLTALMNLDLDLPYGTPGIALGWMAMLGVSLVVFMRRECSPTLRTREFLWAVVPSIGLLQLLYLSHYFGFASHPSSARFFVAFVTFSVMAIATAAPLISNRSFSGLAGVVALVSLLVYHPIAIENRFHRTQIIILEHEILTEFLAENRGKESLTLVDWPGQLFAHEYGAWGFEKARDQAVSLLSRKNNREFLHIYAAQSCDTLTNSPMPDSALDDRFELETLREYPISDKEFFRISRVKAIKIPAVQAKR